MGPADEVSALGLTGEQYAQWCAARGGVWAKGGRMGQLARYAKLFREGRLEQEGMAERIAPIGRVHVSDSSEGDVIKFTQLVSVERLGGVGGGGSSGPVRASSLDTSLPVVGQSPAGAELEIESVLIPMIGRTHHLCYTLCVSSQVGCAMGCGFCQTAQMGLIRSLRPEEIVGQWFAAKHIVAAERLKRPGLDITNIVFMGMGEPMDNVENVIQAIAVLTDRRGPSIAMSKITVSTVGRVDGIERLAESVRQPGWHRLSLAVSLNAPNDEIRGRIMPINRAVPLAKLRTAMENWPLYSSAHLCLEYVLIPGVNDADEHAEQLAAYVLGREYAGPAEFGTAWADRPRLQGLVNVIPYNPRDGSPWPAPGEEAIGRFMMRLNERNVPNKRRRTKGRETMAACGQLGNPEITRAKVRAALSGG